MRRSVAHAAVVRGPVAEPAEFPAPTPLRDMVPVAGLAVPSRPPVIRRSLTISGIDVATPADALAQVKRVSWTPFEEKVLKFMCDNKSHDYELRKSKVREDLQEHLRDMPKSFYRGLKTVQECDEVAAGLEKFDVKDTTGELTKRRDQLFVREQKAQFAPGFGLDTPMVPTKYSRSAQKATKPQSEAGKRPPWQKEPNTYSGKGETGIQNIQLSDKLVSLGLMQKNSFGGWDAVCASCLKWVSNAMMDSDHVQALSILKRRLMTLATIMSTAPSVYDELDDAATKAGTVPSPVSQFFIVKGKGSHRTFRLSEEGLTAYSHNMGNLIKMCKECNQGSGKHGGTLQDWLRNNPYFGPDFADKFPTGPGTSRVVEKSTSGEQPADLIYGQLSSAYAPAVAATHTAHELNLFTHHTVTGNARDRYAAKSLTDPVKKQEMEDELDLRERRGEHLVKSVKSIHEHFKSPNLPPMGSMSPQREQGEFEDFFSGQEEKRKKKRRREAPGFSSFYTSASQGKPTDLSSVGPDMMEIAEQANLEGKQTLERDSAEGTRDALTASLTLDHTAAIQTRPFGYQFAFQDTIHKRAQAVKDGHAHALAGQLLALPHDPDVAVSNQLKLDYAQGYNAGLLEKFRG